MRHACLRGLAAMANTGREDEYGPRAHPAPDCESVRRITCQLSGPDEPPPAYFNSTVGPGSARGQVFLIPIDGISHEFAERRLGINIEVAYVGNEY